MTEDKNKVGRPPKFDSAEKLQKKIEEYFEFCPDTRKVKSGEILLDVPAPTVTGLALFLGFESRQSFYDYEENDEFSYTIKRARTFIEKEYEMMLHGGQCTGAIFALKNLGWSDRTDLRHSGDAKNPLVSMNMEITAEEAYLLLVKGESDD